VATRSTYPKHVEGPGLAPTRTGVERARGILKRRRERSAERKAARLVSVRNRRKLANWLRLIAKTAVDRDPIRRHRDVLLHYRAAAVRTDLLEIAAVLESAHNADPTRIEALHALLANGSDSPLYNARIPFSELEATLDYVRSGL
jgi:hypothetical protein